jgi:hypothetical protein
MGSPPTGRDRVCVARPTRGTLRWAAAGALALAACGSPNPKILDDTQVVRRDQGTESIAGSESDKIRRLLGAVRESDLVFVQDGKEVDGKTAAANLERRLARAPANLTTAREFVDQIAAGRLRAPEPDRVKLEGGMIVPAHEWFSTQLEEIEGNTAGSRRLAATDKPAELGILDALTIIEQSGKRFAAPARQLPNGKLKGKRKEYDASEFATMLRKKWEFIGADIKDLDGFVNEIATDSFSSWSPYMVVHVDGTEEELRAWLLRELETKRKKLAEQAHGKPGIPAGTAPKAAEQAVPTAVREPNEAAAGGGSPQGGPP